MTEFRNVCSVLMTAVACSSLVASSHMSECDPDVPSRPLPTAKHKRQRICNEGHYFDGHCKRCEGGTFMTSQMAKSRRYHRCLPCLQPIENEIIHHPCSITRDTVIFCSEGYFRNISGNTCTFQCAKCSKCGTVTNKNQFEQKPCFGYRDTVCCEKEEQLDGAECAGSDSPSLPKTTTTTTDTPVGVVAHVASILSQNGRNNGSSQRSPLLVSLVFIPVMVVSLVLSL